MVRSTKSDIPADQEAQAPPVEAAPARMVGGTSTPVAVSALGSLSDLPVAGLTRRRIALLLGALVAAWVILLFARQVGEASDATARVVAMRTTNSQLEAQATALQAELVLITRQAYIEQVAREYRLGPAKEAPFVLADDAPPLAADAPGSASVRLGTVIERPTPLESWANLLFGGEKPAPVTPPAESPGTN